MREWLEREFIFEPKHWFWNIWISLNRWFWRFYLLGLVLSIVVILIAMGELVDFKAGEGIFAFEDHDTYVRVFVTFVVGIIGAFLILQQYQIARLKFIEPQIAAIAKSIDDLGRILKTFVDTANSAMGKCPKLRDDLIKQYGFSDDAIKRWEKDNDGGFAPELKRIESCANDLEETYRQLSSTPFVRSVFSYMLAMRRSYPKNTPLNYLIKIHADLRIRGDYRSQLESRTYSEFSGEIANLTSNKNSKDFLFAILATLLKKVSSLELLGLALNMKRVIIPSKKSVKIGNLKIDGVVINIGLASLLELFYLLPYKSGSIIRAMEIVFHLPIGSRIKRVIELMKIGTPSFLGVETHKKFEDLQTNHQKLIWFYTNRAGINGRQYKRIYYDHKKGEHRRAFAKSMKGVYTDYMPIESNENSLAKDDELNASSSDSKNTSNTSTGSTARLSRPIESSFSRIFRKHIGSELHEESSDTSLTKHDNSGDWGELNLQPSEIEALRRAYIRQENEKLLHEYDH